MSDDRTSEFQALAQSLPGTDLRRSAPSGGFGDSKNKLNASGLPNAPASSSGEKGDAAKNNPAYAELRSFQLTAGGISKDIAGTSALLTELTDLVRNQSIISDEHETARINQLVLRIKSSIENLNARLDHAAHVIAQQKRRLGKNSQAGQQAANLVDGLKSEFAEAASGFKKVLQQRTDTMKETDFMQKQVYGLEDGGNTEDSDNPIPNMSLAPLPVYGGSTDAYASGNNFPTLDLTSGMMSTGEATGSTLPRPHGISYSGGGAMSTPYQNNSFFDEDAESERMPMTPLDIQRREEELGLQTQLIPDQEYLQNRAEAMSAVEAHIVELGTVFNKLAGMVAEHREMVQRVEDNVDDANSNISLSMNVLTDTLTSLRSNRTLALRVFSVIVVFVIMFIVFFA